MHVPCWRTCGELVRAPAPEEFGPGHTKQGHMMHNRILVPYAHYTVLCLLTLHLILFGILLLFYYSSDNQNIPYTPAIIG